MLVMLYTFAPFQLGLIPLTKKKVLHYFDVTLMTYFISLENKSSRCISWLRLP